MPTDEDAIREWYASWIRATTEGDLPLANTLIADDALFYVPGAGAMDKASFAAAATADDPNTHFELDTAIEEIEVNGDRAWVTSKFALSMTNKQTQACTKMAGHALSVLRRDGDRWVVIREANTMVPTG